MKVHFLKVIMAAALLGVSSYALADDPTIITLFNLKGSAKITDIRLEINLPPPGKEECLKAPIQISGTTTAPTVVQESQLLPVCVGKQDLMVLVSGYWDPKNFQYNSPAKVGATCSAVHNNKGIFLTTIDLTCQSQ